MIQVITQKHTGIRPPNPYTDTHTHTQFGRICTHILIKHIDRKMDTYVLHRKHLQKGITV